jgi:hypothetical protein
MNAMYDFWAFACACNSDLEGPLGAELEEEDDDEELLLLLELPDEEPLGGGGITGGNLAIYPTFAAVSFSYVKSYLR